MYEILKTWYKKNTVNYLNNFILKKIKPLSISTAWVFSHLKLGFQEKDEGILKIWRSGKE